MASILAILQHWHVLISNHFLTNLIVADRLMD